ncbi:hypothetical protein EXIGLDRAFT_831340 [Exidia glandulosa HHB12029]|uniref:UBR-type domain-containing protein n=1 Tax=Exidia glandulosa HHB12029 TaxID=1314781 RepID=A0A165MQ37_EXIGL|nr:hypothetical protein EXIGLDRAFT_831340 [Exidia glandulosa HHB12029]
MNPTSQTTREFLPQYARLVPEFKMARFMTLSVKSPGMEEVMETLSVALIPTVLTFCSDGFFRTTGKDLVSLRNDITRAVNDMAAMAIIKQWPRAQIDYNRAEALAFWRALPNQLQDVATLAAVDHGVRVKLLHTLPYVEDVDPNSYKALKDAQVMQHYCAHYFIKGETMYSCYDCGVNGEFADYCEKCWNNATHDGHTAIKRTAPHDNFICDCGRLSRTGSGDVIGAHCSLHQDQSQTDALATLLALSVLLGAR